MVGPTPKPGGLKSLPGVPSGSMRVSRGDAWAAGLLSVLALALRLALLKAAPYGDEAGHYAISRTLGVWGDNIDVIGGKPLDLSPWVAGRPAFALLYAPGAWLGFTAFRLEGIVVASLLPALGYAWLRNNEASRATASAAGLVLAVHPAMVVWGARVFPDSLMAALFLGGLVSGQMGRRRLGIALLFLACMAKETAVPAVAGLAVAQFLEARRLQQPSRAAIQLVAVTGCAILVEIAAYLYAGGLPGWARGGDRLSGFETALWSTWLVVPALAGLASRRARTAAAPLTALAGFYAAFILLRHGATQAWYCVLPLTLGVLATAQLVSDSRRARDWTWLAGRTGAVTASLLATMAVLGGTSLTHPLGPHDDPGLARSFTVVNTEGQDLAHAARLQADLRPRRVFMIDVLWYDTYYPFRGSDSTTISYPLVQQPGQVPAAAMQRAAQAADLVWLQWWDGGFEQRFDAAHGDCRVFSEGIYRAYQPARCPADATAAFWAQEAAQGS